MGGAPPSPSTLTDIILTLHAALYGAKRTREEIQEMALRYYDANAGTSASSRECLKILWYQHMDKSTLSTSL